MFKNKTIQYKIFVSHFALVIGLTSVLFIVYYLYTANNIKNNVISTYQELVNSATIQLDKEVSNMDILSRDILTSHVMYTWNNLSNLDNRIDYDFSRTYIYNYFFDRIETNSSANNGNLRIGTDDIIVNMINTLNGSDARVKEVLMYDGKGRLEYAPYNIDEDEFKSELNIKQSEKWFEQLSNDIGKKVLGPPVKNGWYGREIYVISFYRSFESSIINRNDKGIIEVQQDYGVFENIIKKNFQDKSTEVYLYDDQGNSIYPVDNLKENMNSIEKWTKGKTGVFYSVADTIKKKRVTLVSRHSDITGWTTVLAIDDKTLFAEAKIIGIWVILIMCIVLIIEVLIDYTLTKSITIPLRLLHQYISKLKIENLAKQQEKKLLSSSKEISEVYLSFKSMCSKLDKSLGDVIDARIKESEAHWQALQAQMNPHFIYNTLAVIAAACDDHQTENASYMCGCLSNMMRYVTKSSGFNTTLKNEMNYVHDYLSIMKKRYEESLIYRVDIPEKMMDIKLPKLVLQPLVENCINHGFRDRKPPWEIGVSGRMLEASWEIQITDNGCGVDIMKLEEIKARIADYEDYPVDNGNLGLGLANTLVRLKLKYKDKFNYKLENREHGGFSISLGCLFEQYEGDEL